MTLRGFWAELSAPGRWLLSTVAVVHVGRGLTLPFTAIYLHEVRHFSLDVTGLLMGTIAVVGLLITGPGGLLVDRLGAGRVLLISNVLGGLANALLAVTTTVPVALVAFVLLGLGWGVAWPSANALISRIVAGPARQTYFAVNFALLNLGIGVGGVVAGMFVDVHRPETFVAIYLADAATALIPVALLLGPVRSVTGPVPHEPDPEASHPTSYLAILRQPVFAWLSLLTLVSSFVGYGMMEVGIPGFARSVSRVPTQVVGFAFAANTVTIVLLQFLTMRLIAGHRRTRVLVVMAGVWALSWAMLGATGIVPGTGLAAAGVVGYLAVFGVGETLLQPSVPAMVNDLAADHVRGRYNSASAASFQVGAILAPYVAGVLLDRGLAALLIGLCVGGCGLIAVIALVIERRVTPRVNGLDTEMSVEQGQPA